MLYLFEKGDFCKTMLACWLRSVDVAYDESGKCEHAVRLNESMTPKLERKWQDGHELIFALQANLREVSTISGRHEEAVKLAEHGVTRVQKALTYDPDLRLLRVQERLALAYVASYSEKAVGFFEQLTANCRKLFMTTLLAY
jgi:hypothetical protein